jgi:divalent metal cation (Fe/Co/Zn/Cd) transporter
VLGLGLVLDGVSWLTSVRQLRREARSRDIPFRLHLGSTTDTAVTAVFYEDAAALLGNVIAITGLVLQARLGSPAPDAAAGIAIGILLAAVGLRLAARNRALLTNRSDSVIVLDRIRDLLGAHPDIAGVGAVATAYLGPHHLLVTAEVQPVDALSGRRVSEVIAELRVEVTEAVPRAQTVLVSPVLAIPDQPELTPWDRDYWLRRTPDPEQA